MRLPLAATLAILSGLLCGCGSEPPPQQQVRELLERATESAGDRDLDQLREFVSKDYEDSEGRDRRAVMQMVALYLRQTETLFVRTRIRSIEIVGSGAAEATVVAAIADVPINDLNLQRLSADFLRFELSLRLEAKEWRVVRAGWESVPLTEYLKPGPLP